MIALCGEGWLVRELTMSGLNCLSVDVVPELIEYAKKEGDGNYKVVSFEDLTIDVIKEKSDVIVCNFSLPGNESVISVLQHSPSLLNDNGTIIIQTIHPVSGFGEGKYEDGWREGSWAGFSSEFSDPAPWYFRTLDAWKTLFVENSFVLKKIIEPLDPKTQKPASVIFISQVVTKI